MSGNDLASWVFGAVSLLYLAAIATYLIVRKRSDALPPAAEFIIGFLCAVAGGFCTYFFTGKLGLNFEIPGTGLKGDAAGGIGVFVLVLVLAMRFHARSTDATKSRTVLAAFDRALSDLEEIWKAVSAMQHGRVPTPSVTHRKFGHGDSEKIQFTEVGQTAPTQVLTIDQVRTNLSPDEQRLLVDTEASMNKKIEAWKRESAKLGDPAEANAEGKMRLLRIASSMDADLNAIFGAIERTLDGRLQDHYQAERWIASAAAGLLQSLELEKAAGGKAPA